MKKYPAHHRASRLQLLHLGWTYGTKKPEDVDDKLRFSCVLRRRILTVFQRSCQYPVKESGSFFFLLCRFFLKTSFLSKVSSNANLRLSISPSTYSNVTAILECPSRVWTTFRLRSGDFIISVAIVCRNRCGLIVQRHSTESLRKKERNGGLSIFSVTVSFLPSIRLMLNNWSTTSLINPLIKKMDTSEWVV